VIFPGIYCFLFSLLSLLLRPENQHSISVAVNTMSNLRRFISIILFMLPALQLYAQPLSAGETENFTRMMNEQQELWNKGDIDGYMSYYWNSDSLIFISQGRKNMGWQTTCSNYKTKYPDAQSRGKLEFSNLFFYQLNPDLVIATGSWKLSRAAGNLEGSFTLVWKKILNEWKIIIDHTV
jgi:ketosteroid isomerase-like protein